MSDYPYCDLGCSLIVWTIVCNSRYGIAAKAFPSLLDYFVRTSTF